MINVSKELAAVPAVLTFGEINVGDMFEYFGELHLKRTVESAFVFSKGIATTVPMSPEGVVKPVNVVISYTLS